MLNKKIFGLSTLFFVSIAYACGPWISVPYTLRNDDVFYSPPEVGFSAEIRHLLPDAVPHQAVTSLEVTGGPSAAAELREVLKASGMGQAQLDTIVANYEHFRGSLNGAKQYVDTPVYEYFRRSVDQVDRAAKLKALTSLQVPPDLPEEYRLYLEGALVYYRGDTHKARSFWQALLQLPESERRYRSVMAAFMLARSGTDSSVHTSYEQVRELVASGYPDRLGLAASSYGWQAQAYLRSQSYQNAFNLYLKQWASGYGNAIRSLEMTAENAWENAYGDPFEKLIDNEMARSVMTAYLLTQYESERVAKYRERLLKALPDAKTLSMAEAGRFALLEYQHNNLSAARLWIGFAAPDDALAMWVRSKLLLRAGKIDEGRAIMTTLTEAFDGEEPDWRRLDTKRAWAELGLLYLRDGRYVEAADAFWNADSWQDCAYVLERLMMTDELLAWLKDRPTKATHMNGTKARLDYPERLKSLTARRLMREARFEEALDYFGDYALEKAKAYIHEMQAAHNEENSVVDRAEHFWKAARIMREDGIGLFGSELAPDNANWGGNYGWGGLADKRNERRWDDDFKINRLARDEIGRAHASRIRPDKRYHYRYRAVQLAELAAGLLPNGDENAARIYVVSASWIKSRDPELADRLFKQLAVRCPQTELGKAALVNNWFPEVDLAQYEPFTSDEVSGSL